MFQLVVVYSIVFVTVLYAVYRIYMVFKDVKKKKLCDGGCTSCSIKNEIVRLKHGK